MMSLTTLSTAEIVGTNLTFGLAPSAVGGLIHAGPAAKSNTTVLWKLLIGGVAGAIAGASFASRIESKKLRFALCLALVYIGSQLSWTSFSKMYSTSVSAAGPGHRHSRLPSSRTAQRLQVLLACVHVRASGFRAAPCPRRMARYGYSFK